MDRKIMRVIIITGMSGAGKTNAANMLEDMGYYCVDNMPIDLMQKFMEYCISARGRYEKVALVTDVRSGDNFDHIMQTIEMIDNMGCACSIIYMEADVNTIIRRYKESRRPHPLSSSSGSLNELIAQEVDKLENVRKAADLIIDTSELSISQLKKKFSDFLDEGSSTSMQVEILSFGYKYGLPIEADLVFDVRFIPNPFYKDELRSLTGLDEPVREFLFGFSLTREFITHIKQLLNFLLPAYVEEGKSTLTIAIGCTGGRHRSTAIAYEIYEYIRDQGYTSSLSHRDITEG